MPSSAIKMHHGRKFGPYCILPRAVGGLEFCCLCSLHIQDAQNRKLKIPFYWLNLKWPSNAQSFGSFASHGSSVCRQRDILFAKDLFETSNPRRFLQDFCEYHKLEWIGRPCSNADTQAIQERLNRVKARKWYRPVAPMIAEEALEQVFGKRVHSTYMSMAPRVQDWVSGMVWRVPGH